MKRKVTMALAVLTVAMLSVLPLGCVNKASVQKLDLTGQLKKLNAQVTGLNDKTSSLVDVIKALDAKEAQLSTSVELLNSVDAETATQISTIRSLASIVASQRSGVAAVLGLGNQVLTMESGLKLSTSAQLGMAGTTLDLVNALMGNLGNFKNINNGIINKMDRALGIMGNM
ncbi:MAG TPA: hypothetical protein VIK02_08795 [Candidatus Anoxymicrobiaceae bacterium]